MRSPRPRLPLVFASLASLLLVPACTNGEGGGEGEGDSETSEGEGDSASEGDSAGDLQEVVLQFAAVVGDQPAACGESYAGIGSQGTTVELQDLRFYVSEVELLDAEGGATPLELTQDGLWQYEDVALLDFEDGSAGCQDSGTAETNDAIFGTVPVGEYTGLRFTLGVPFELNHQDVASAPSPLNVPSMFWVWQGGYKFARIDLRNEQAENNDWFWHQGSTGCESSGPESPPEQPCLRSNRVIVEFDAFDWASQSIVLDLASFLADVDVGQNTMDTPPGCMSAPSDPECVELYPRLGLDLDSGACMSDCSEQQLFHVE